MIYIFIILILAGCTFEPIREFNNDEQQDLGCYGKYGGQLGYCDRRR